MKYIDLAAYILLIVGGLNWGLVGAFGFNLVSALFGQTMLAKAVYSLVGLSAVYKLVGMATGKCSSCSSCDK